MWQPGAEDAKTYLVVRLQFTIDLVFKKYNLGNILKLYQCISVGTMTIKAEKLGKNSRLPRAPDVPWQYSKTRMLFYYFKATTEFAEKKNVHSSETWFERARIQSLDCLFDVKFHKKILGNPWTSNWVPRLVCCSYQRKSIWTENQQSSSS